MRDRSSSKRGLILLSFLGLAVLGVGGAAVALWGPSRTPSRGLTREQRLAAVHSACAEERWPGAEELLRTLLAEDPKDLNLRLLMARVLLELGKVSQARQLYDQIHKEKPDTAEAVIGLGRVHESLGELDHAIACYRRATEMRPSDGLIHRRLGLALLKKGDSIAALFSIRQSLKVQPGQEDLSRLMNEIGASRQARLDHPNARRSTSPFDPFEDMHPGNPGGRSGFPRPSVPDPLEGLPRPGAGGRVR